MSVPVTVVDYGIGNLHSVLKALRHVGATPQLTEDPIDVGTAERVVLPGVGAFADGMAGLEARGMLPALASFFETGRPFLGICVGMQLLLGRSTEFGDHPGLGAIPGDVRRIEPGPGFKVPQIGWNRIAPPPGTDWSDTLLAGTEPGTMMYFVHTYTAAPADEAHRLADAAYGAQRVSAMIRRDNLYGCQFHPEKSGEAGLEVLQRFVRL